MRVAGVREVTCSRRVVQRGVAGIGWKVQTGCPSTAFMRCEGSFMLFVIVSVAAHMLRGCVCVYVCVCVCMCVCVRACVCVCAFVSVPS